MGRVSPTIDETFDRDLLAAEDREERRDDLGIELSGVGPQQFGDRICRIEARVQEMLVRPAVAFDA